MRIAMITGASSGMGREFARQIDRLYANLDEIWIVARNTGRLKELGETLSHPVRIFDGDLTRDYIYERIVKELNSVDGDIRMLVNAAGYGKIGQVEDVDRAEQLGMIDVNCRALTRMTLMCLPYMGKGSRILQIASAAAFLPQPGFAIYAATKSYAYSFSRGLRQELLPRGIMVTAVCPGPVDTAFFERAGALTGEEKQKLMAKPELVVRRALLDAVKGKACSVYGPAMKIGRIVARLLPEHLTIAALWKMNRTGGRKKNED